MMKNLTNKKRTHSLAAKAASPVGLCMLGLLSFAVRGVDFSHAADPMVPATQPTVKAAGALAPQQPMRNDQSERRSRRNRGGNNNNNGAPAASVAYSSSQSITDQIKALQTRSIFIKGNQTIAVRDDTPRIFNGGAATGPMVGRPESSLVFNGVIMVDTEADALIEDISSHRVSTVRPGDPIAGGKVSAITFDELTYQVGGVSKRVTIGQDLDGKDAVFSDSSAVPSTPPTPVPGNLAAPATPTTPAQPGAIPSGASPEDILARMKAKRAQEISGK